MILTIKTSELQEMTSKAIKCVANNKLIPLTSLMSLKVVENHFVITTTDANNYFQTMKEEKVDCEDFEVSVMADTFAKLIQKLSSETTVLEVSGGTVTVKCNGSYSFELPLDENGNTIKFPNRFNGFVSEYGEIKLSSIKNILAINKPALATDMDFPVLTCYYCGDKVLTSDRKVVTCYASPIFTLPLIITPSLMELLGIMTSETIGVFTNEEGAFIFETPTDKIYSPKANFGEYPVPAINNLLTQSFESYCILPRGVVLNVLDRLSIFTSAYDVKCVNITTTPEGVMFSTKKSNGQETVPYLSSVDFKPYMCSVSIEKLKNQLAANNSDSFELYYGIDSAIKIKSGNITQIIALLQGED